MDLSFKSIEKLLMDLEERQQKQQQKRYNKKVGYAPKCSICNDPKLNKKKKLREDGYTLQDIKDSLQLDCSIMALSRHFKNHYPQSQAYKEKLQLQTSTIKGFKEYEKELYSRLGINFKSNETDLKKKFWNLVHRYEEQATDENSNWLSGGGSPVVFEYIANNLSDWEKMTIEQKNAKITQLYEEITGKKQQKKKGEIKTESDLFEDAYEDEGEF